MACKNQKRAAGTSQHPTYDSSQFISELVEDDFNANASNSFINEIPIDRAYLYMEKEEMYKENWRREMELLFDDPAPVNRIIVHEFYANCPANLLREVIVRGKVVDATTERIHHVLRLPRFTGIDYYHYAEGVTWEVMTDILCAGGRPTWIKDNITLNSNSFTHLAKRWLTVICSWFMPSSNTTDVNF